MTQDASGRRTTTLAERWQAWRQALAVYRDRKMLVILFMGFASGTPFVITGAFLSYWMAQENIDLTTIGLFALASTPYALKFAWSPIIDQTGLPLLDRWLGRRRSWMLLSQLGLVGAILLLGFSHPKEDIELTALAAVLVAFLSATQDIVVDAYRIEILSDQEQGAGSASTQLGYRIAMWVVDAVGLALPAFIGWQWSFAIAAILMGIGIVTTLACKEPDILHQRAKSAAEWLKQAVWQPFAAFMLHYGWLAILLFAVMYKFGDSIGSWMSRPFYNAMGFPGPEIFAVTKSFGVAATIAGSIVGGVLVARYGIFRALLIGGIAQAATNLTFTWLAVSGHDIGVLTAAITIDYFTNSIGNIAFVAYLSSLCTRGLAATQYALLTSLVAFSRTVLSSASGKMAELAGWPMFWALTALLAIPGLLLLLYLWRLERKPAVPKPA